MMARFIAVVTASFLILVATITSTMACEEYSNLTTSEMKEYRDKLIEAGADPFDRLFAFESLVCSDNPTIRAYAVREGLKASSDSLVRNRIMFEALMQKTRIDVDLVPGRDATAADKDFAKGVAGTFSRQVSHRDRTLGCLGLSFSDCRGEDSVFIKGDVVEYNRGHATGLFKLSDQNELVGYFRPRDEPKFSKIPAIIKLF